MNKQKTITLSARIPAEIAEAVKAECRTQKRYPAAWVVEAVMEKIARSEQQKAEHEASEIVATAVRDMAKQASGLLEACFARIGEALEPATAEPQPQPEQKLRAIFDSFKQESEHRG